MSGHKPWSEIKKKNLAGACDRCSEHTDNLIIWSESAMDYIHGAYQHYCERCTVEEQLGRAKQLAERIPNLEDRLAFLGGPSKFVRCWKNAWAVIDGVFGSTGNCVLAKGHEGDCSAVQKEASDS